MLVIGTDNWIGKYIYDYLNKNSSFHNTEIKIDNIIKNKKPYNDFNSIKQNLKSLIIEYKNNNQNHHNVICCIYNHSEKIFIQ